MPGMTYTYCSSVNDLTTTSDCIQPDPANLPSDYSALLHSYDLSGAEVLIKTCGFANAGDTCWDPVNYGYGAANGSGGTNPGTFSTSIPGSGGGSGTGSGTGSPPNFSTLTQNVDFTGVIAAILTVAALIAGLKVCVWGCRFLLRALNPPVRD